MSEDKKRIAEAFIRAGESEKKRAVNRLVEEIFRQPFNIPEIFSPPPSRDNKHEIVVCRGCGQKNSVPRERPEGKRPICARCRAPL